MIQIPGYFIKREVGVGGMATVYLAVQTSLEREVALKVMNPALVSDPNFSRRFLMEARTLASLSHPNIVAVYDVGVSDSQLHYFSMQHLPGGDFTKRIKQGLGEPDILRVLAGVARALGFAHVRGFVHRDVSPANVLFDSTGSPILTDFGIARAVTRTSRLTNAGVSVGTSHYMSPEQARGGNVDARSDIYSLGAVTYEALTGTPPFDGEDGFAIAYAHVFEPVPRLPPNLAHWQPLIDQALAKHPNERFLDCDGFLNALDKVAESVGVPPVTGQQRAVGGATVAMAIPAELAQPEQPVPVTMQVAAVPASDEARTISTVMPAALRTPSQAPSALRADVEPPNAAPPPRSRSPWLLPAIVVVLGLGGLAAALLGDWDKSKDAPADVVATPSPTPAPTPNATPADPVATPGGDAPIATIDPAATDPLVAPDDPYAYPGDDDPGTTVDVALLPDGTEMTPEEQAAAAATEQAEAERVGLATTVIDPINTLLAIARNDLVGKRLSLPPGRNALDRYRLALKIAERFRARADIERAKQGIAATAMAYLDLAEEKAKQNNTVEFLDYLARGEEIARSLPEGAPALARAQQRRNGLRDAEIAKAQRAALAWDRAGAIAAYERALQFDPKSAEAQKGLKGAQRIGEPGFVFRDALKAGGTAPEMVVANAGGKRIAAARSETTLAEFRAYWKAQGASTRGGDRPKCRDREGIFSASRKNSFESPDFEQAASHPVVCVSWADAADYAKWLSAQTGKRYRLPSESEWSALARAAPTAPCKANLADSDYIGKYSRGAAFECRDGYAATAPARRFDAAAPGVYDIAGNAREWVGDCASCKEHVAMGSAWHSFRDKASPTQRMSFDADLALNTVGFRVVREVD